MKTEILYIISELTCNYSINKKEKKMYFKERFVKSKLTRKKSLKRRSWLNINIKHHINFYKKKFQEKIIIEEMINGESKSIICNLIQLY